MFVTPPPLGTIVAVYLGAVLHTAVYAGRDKDGDWVIDLSPSSGVARRQLMIFARGARIEFRFYPGSFEAKQVYLRAFAQIGVHDYHWWDSNCQQFTCWCATDRWISQQVEEIKPWCNLAVGIAGLIAVGVVAQRMAA